MCKSEFRNNENLKARNFNGLLLFVCSWSKISIKRFKLWNVKSLNNFILAFQLSNFFSNYSLWIKRKTIEYKFSKWIKSKSTVGLLFQNVNFQCEFIIECFEMFKMNYQFLNIRFFTMNNIHRNGLFLQHQKCIGFN